MSVRGPGNIGKGREKGFTLLEIVISLFLLSILVTTVFGAARFMFGQADDGTAGIDSQEMVAVCLNRIAQDLGSIQVGLPPVFVSAESREEADPYRVVGSVDQAGGKSYSRLRFASSAHLAMDGRPPREGVAEIVYYVREDADDTPTLYRADRIQFETPLSEDRFDPVLCRPLSSLKFGYVAADGQTRELWDSESADDDYLTPRAVSVELGIAEGEAVRRYRAVVALPVYRDSLSDLGGADGP